MGEKETNMELKGNTQKFEMSRYIDLDLYHEVERSHPFYIEMTTEIQNKIIEFHKSNDQKLKLLEMGAGTGLFTQDLVKYNWLDVDALEIDSECMSILSGHVGHGVNCICDNAITYSKKDHYDLIVSTFSHDHIHHDKAKEFVTNINNNLKSGGLYIMGGEVLPKFSNDSERKQALLTYHTYIVAKALQDGNYTLAQIEISALKSGIEMIGDFKRDEERFEQEMQVGQLKLLDKIKVGPQVPDDVGGVFVYVFQKS
ncbi:hypothetical protein BVY03_03390 [bacterium K02(2017)]|nr:hypothetical protein BVY03_03390 [bacterium K02(2017)]